jgi:hypothetical protein
MTVTTTTTKVSYTGDGSTVAFAVSYPFQGTGSSAEITVVERTIATGAEVTKTNVTHYAVTGGDGSTGTVTAVTAPASTVQWHIRRNTTQTQTTDYVTNDPFPADTHEGALDRLAMTQIEQQEELDRAAAYPETYTGGASAVLPEPVAGAYLTFNAAGNGITTSTDTAAQWLGGNGTVSLPYYSFSADPNTGLYRIGADNVGLALGGAKVVDFGTAKTIFASTVEAGADTAAGDNAAMGYTAAEGLILTGQGSTNDVTIKNDADAIVAKVATGTTNFDVIGNITGTDLTLSGDLTVNGTTVSLQITNQVTADPLVELNNGATSNANDLGVIMERGSTGDNIFVGWDESADEFIAATTTGTGSSTGNLTLAGYANAKFANVSLAQLTATSGTLAGLTSLAMSAGATLTAGFLDQDDMSSDSAVAGVTQQSVKAYVDAAIKAPGIQLAWEANTTDTDQGAGKIWANNGTLASATVLYIDDVDAAGVSINAFVDTLDDPTATNSALIYVAEAGSGSAGVVFAVSGGVTSASTYSKIAVTHVATIGTLADGDSVGMVVAYSGNNGAISSVAEDTTPQLGGFLDTNDKFISHSQGAAIASVAGDTNIWTNFDGNTVHITGTNAITDFGTPKQAGDSMWVIFDAAASVVDSSTITCAGNTNFQAAANDLALVYALTTSTFLFMPFKNDGGSPVAAASGGPAIAMITHTSDTALATQSGGGSQMGSAVSMTVPAAGVIRVTPLIIEYDETEGSATGAFGIALKVGSDSLIWVQGDLATGSSVFAYAGRANTSVSGLLEPHALAFGDGQNFLVEGSYVFDIVGHSITAGVGDIEVWLGDNVNSTTGEITITGTSNNARFLVEIIDGS